MKIKLIITLLGIGCISMAALQAAKPLAVMKDKIRQTINLKNGNVSDYTYTTSGRISGIKTSKGISSTYEYTNTMAIKKLNNPVTKTTTIDTIILNSKGLAATIYQPKMPQSAAIPIQCEYDNEGHLLVSKYEYKGKDVSRDEATYIDGNKVSIRQSYESEKINMLYFTYYTDRRNTISDDNMGMGYMGKASKNPCKELIAVSTAGDTTRTEYFYHYDAQGRILIKASYGGLKLVDSVQYSYY